MLTEEEKILATFGRIGEVKDPVEALSGERVEFTPVEYPIEDGPRNAHVVLGFRRNNREGRTLTIRIRGSFMSSRRPVRDLDEWCNRINTSSEFGLVTVRHRGMTRQNRHEIGVVHTFVVGALTEDEQVEAFRTMLAKWQRTMWFAQVVLASRAATAARQSRSTNTDEGSNAAKGSGSATPVPDQRSESAPSPARPATALERLEAMTGMDSLKQHLEVMRGQVRLDSLRRAQGMKSSLKAGHLVFTGAPGTGKTTAARLYGEVLKELGILSKGHVVEVGRSDLVGAYIGHSAIRTKTLCDSALDGVLFIDEAYSLCADGRDFGGEVIATLLTFMENNRGRIVVIVAGYPEQMENFMTSNPGLQSRFDHIVPFDRYSIGGLLAIFKDMVNDADFDITPSALAEVRACLVGLSSADRDGNARTVRRMVDEMIAQHARMVARIDKPSATQLRLLTAMAVPKHWVRVGEIDENDLPSVTS